MSDDAGDDLPLFGGGVADTNTPVDTPADSPAVDKTNKKKDKTAVAAASAGKKKEKKKPAKKKPAKKKESKKKKKSIRIAGLDDSDDDGCNSDDDDDDDSSFSSNSEYSSDSGRGKKKKNTKKEAEKKKKEAEKKKKEAEKKKKEKKKQQEKKKKAKKSKKKGSSSSSDSDSSSSSSSSSDDDNDLDLPFTSDDGKLEIIHLKKEDRIAVQGTTNKESTRQHIGTLKYLGGKWDATHGAWTFGMNALKNVSERVKTMKTKDELPARKDNSQYGKVVFSQDGLELLEYSDKALVIRGAGTYKLKDKLKELGKFNANLRIGGADAEKFAGYITSRKQESKCIEFIKKNTVRRARSSSDDDDDDDDSDSSDSDSSSDSS